MSILIQQLKDAKAAIEPLRAELKIEEGKLASMRAVREACAAEIEQTEAEAAKRAKDNAKARLAGKSPSGDTARLENKLAASRRELGEIAAEIELQEKAVDRANSALNTVEVKASHTSHQLAGILSGNRLASEYVETAERLRKLWRAINLVQGSNNAIKTAVQNYGHMHANDMHK